VPASLSADGKIHACCRYCRRDISRFPYGKLWQDATMSYGCQDSPVGQHAPER
jgi:hypothetical protein